MQTTQSPIGSRTKAHIAGVDLELWEGGKGQTMLLLHPGDGFNPDDAYVQKLASRHRVIAPSHPGFGESSLPKHIRTVDDLSYFYLDLLDEMKLDNVVLAGISFGGWIAVEMAVKNTSRLASVVLADSVGVKFEGPFVREIADLFSIPHYENPSLLYHDEKLRHVSYAGYPDDVLLKLARNYESFGLFSWSPTLHDPKLKSRLHRIKVPTQIIWGAQDRVVSPEYGRSLAKAIPGAAFELIDGAGHYAHIEQPERFALAVSNFTEQLAGQHGKPSVVK